MNIRSTIFWAKDKCVGHSRVRKVYNEVRTFIESGEENLSQRENILSWATSEVPFYASYKGKSFHELPVVCKNIIRENPEQFKAKSFLGQKLHSESTSGSTGTPFTIYQDPGKRLRASADSLVFSDLAGFALGTRLYYVRVWNELNKKSKLQTILKNIVMQDSKSLSEGNLENFVRTLENDSQHKTILSYANTITALYKWMKDSGRTTTAQVDCIITMSESLPPEVKEGIKKLFRCPVVSRYSNQECGLISQQAQDGDEYVVNTASFYVELLALDSDQPVEDGKLGRIVITDLYNKAMPLLRYDTGDLGIMSHVSSKGRKGTFITKVEGRSNDFIFSTTSELLSPVTISVGMWKFNHLIQSRFVQNGKNEYEMQLKSATPQYAREAELLSDLRQCVGADANIRILYVDDIPLLKSGKRKYVVNNMNS
jgi:phenylacetate-CoA ligase